MKFLSMFGIGDNNIFDLNCNTNGVVTHVHRCWWFKIKTKPVRIYATIENTAYPHIITFSYAVDGKTYEGKRYVDIRYRVPQIGETITVYYDPQKPQNYACYAVGPGMTEIGR